MQARQSKSAAPAAAPTTHHAGGKPAVANPAAQTRLPAWSQACGERLSASLFGLQQGIQAKLEISQPDDPYEQEANRVAERVMHTPEPSVQRRCACGGTAGPDGECAACRARRMGVQRKTAVPASPTAAPPIVHSVLDSPGQPLDAGTRAFMEPRFGADFGHVRIHTDSQAAGSARAVNALAYTVGQNVVFGAGQYQLGSSAGQRLLAHELAHVVQQGATPQSSVEGFRVQRASLISESEYFLFTGAEEQRWLTFSDLVGAVRRRYQLDPLASTAVARWLDRRDRILNGASRILVRRDFVVRMPRALAFFLVDWVEPFNPYAGAATPEGDYRIQPEAFRKAQQMWEHENVFVDFRRGGPIRDPGRRRIDFTPSIGPDGTPRRTAQSELDLLALHPTGPLPPGFFRIVVTGSTTEGSEVFGKSIRSRPDEQVAAGSQGILLFAQTYADAHFRQTAPLGSEDRELGELLAHEIGHFLFNLSHYEEPEITSGAMHIVEKTDFMRPSGTFDPNDRLGATSRRQIDQAFREGAIPRPENPTP
jgi:hypothetical protein